MRVLCLLVFLCASVGYAANATNVTSTTTAVDEEERKRWMFAVEEILAAVSMGPLRPQFTPEYLGNRTPESVLKAQTSALRAHVVQRLIGAWSNKVVACLDLVAFHAEGIKAVVSDLKKQTFDVVWSKSEDGCFGGEALVITGLPFPKPAAPTAAGVKE
jgi:hypothetical protein